MKHLNGILFIDIETVPIEPSFDRLSQGMQNEWARKAKNIKTTDDMTDPGTLFSEKAGVYAEFAKVICISFGTLHVAENDTYKMRLRSIANDDEHKLLSEFCEMVNKFIGHYNEIRFCGHNIKEFDIPFLCRRMVINSIQLPACMQLAGKKPWEVNHLDTMELWKFGDHKHFTSLSLLAQILGIPSPKADIDGSMVAGVYWKEHGLARISAYCQQDVLTCAKVYLKLQGISASNVEPIYPDQG